MLREKTVKATKYLVLGMTVAFGIAAINPATVKADMVQESGTHDTLETSTPIPLNTWVKGSCSDVEEDWYQFRIEQKGETHIEIRPDTSNTAVNSSWTLELYDDQHNWLCDWEAHASNSMKLGWAPGRYYLRIEGAESEDIENAYNLMVHNTPTDQWENERNYAEKNLSNANLVSLNKKYTGSLYCDQDVDYYRIKMNGKNAVNLNFTIDETVADPGVWQIALYEYKTKSLFRTYNIGTDKKITIPECDGDLLVEISSMDADTIGQIYHIQAAAKLCTPEITSINAGKHKATLHWKKVNNATGYYVYRGNTKNGTYKKIATVTGKTSYVDKKSLNKSGTYYYKLVAFRKSGSKISKSAASASYSKYIS